MAKMSRHSQRSYRWRQLRSAILAASDICWLCGRPGANEIDHVEPASMRPDLALDPANLRPAHATCNRKRGSKPANVALGASRRW